MRHRAMICLVFCAALACLTFAQDAPKGQDKEVRVKQIQKEISELKAKLILLEKELATLTIPKPIDPSTVGFAGPDWSKEARKLTLKPGSLGTFGEFGYLVEEVIGENMVLVSIGRPGELTFLVKGASTKGMVDNERYRMRGVWHVSDTQKHGSKTYLLVEGRGYNQFEKVDK